MAFWKKAENAAGQESAPPATGSAVDVAAPVATAAAGVASDAGHAPAPQSQSQQPELSEEERRGAAMKSKAVMAAFGEIVTVLMRTAEHRGQTLSDLEWLVVPAVVTGQFALAEAQSKTNGMMAPVGLVMWAWVSAEVDQRLRTSLDQPLKLKAEEWRSGDNLWIIEAVGEPKLMQAMLQNTAKSQWNGKNANLRVRAPDGTMKVATLTQQRPEGAPPA